jgi:hypothetical protein
VTLSRGIIRNGSGEASAPHVGIPRKVTTRHL